MRRNVALALATATLLGCRPRSAPVAAPAAIPSTDVYLYRFGQPSGVFNITNRGGYDNQPSWDGNARILYTAIEDGQADVRYVDFTASASGRVIRTPESEYSPAITPDGRAISVVRVEVDSTQRLWRFPTDGSAPSVILPNVKPVGYYAWLDSTTLALYVLGSGTEPNTLRIADIRTGSTRVVTTSIGRSLQRVPGGRRASYVRRVAGTWVLETVHPVPRADGSFDVDTIAALPDSAEYVVWQSSEVVYTAAGSRIFRLRRGGSWEQIDDLNGKGIRRITRLALSPDGTRLALVADEP